MLYLTGLGTGIIVYSSSQQFSFDLSNFDIFQTKVWMNTEFPMQYMFRITCTHFIILISFVHLPNRYFRPNNESQMSTTCCRTNPQYSAQCVAVRSSAITIIVNITNITTTTNNISITFVISSGPFSDRTEDQQTS